MHIFHTLIKKLSQLSILQKISFVFVTVMLISGIVAVSLHNFVPASATPVATSATGQNDGAIIVGTPEPNGAIVDTNVAPAMLVFNTSQHISLPTFFPIVFYPRNGENTIQLLAAGFPAFTCSLQWEQNAIQSHTCPIVNGNIAMDETLSDLLPSKQGQILSLMQSEPIGPGTVWSMTAQPGSHIPDGAGSFVASTPYQVTMRRVLNLSTITYSVGSIGFSPPHISHEYFIFEIFLTDVWQFVSADGKQVITRDVPDIEHVTISVQMTAASILHVMIGPPYTGGPESGWDTIYGSSAGCNESTAVLNVVFPPSKYLTYILAESGVHGCLFEMVPPKSTATSFSAYPMFLLRFGLLLAADAKAQQLEPSFPVASQGEINDVQSANICIPVEACN